MCGERYSGVEPQPPAPTLPLPVCHGGSVPSGALGFLSGSGPVPSPELPDRPSGVPTLVRLVGHKLSVRGSVCLGPRRSGVG